MNGLKLPPPLPPSPVRSQTPPARRSTSVDRPAGASPKAAVHGFDDFSSATSPMPSPDQSAADSETPVRKAGGILSRSRAESTGEKPRKSVSMARGTIRDKLRRSVSLATMETRVWPSGWSPTSRDSIRGHTGAVNAIRAYHQDMRVLSCGDDGTLRRNDLLTGLPIGNPLKGHDGPVTDCCVFPGGSLALSIGDDKTLRVWDLARSTCVKKIDTEHDGPVTSCCLIPTKEARGEGAPTREYALTASTDKTLKVWDLQEERLVFTLTGSGGAVHSCCVFSSAVGGRWEGQLHALSAGQDNHVRRWSLDDLEDATGKFTDAKDRQVLQQDDSPWLSKQDALKGKVGHSGVVNCCVVSEDGTRALSCAGDRTSIYWDLTTGEALRLLNDPNSGASMYGCCFLQNSSLALTVSAFAPRVWDIHSGELLRTFCGHTGDVTGCQAILGGTKALTCGKQGTVRVWDISQGDNTVELSKEEGHSHVVKELCLIPGDKLMALSCSYDKTAKVWDLTRGSCLATLKGHEHNVNECCVFPAPADGQQVRKVLTGSGDGTIKIWDWPTETCELTLGKEQHTSEVRGCGVFDGGRKVYSCSKDSTICVFELEFDGHTQKPLSGRLVHQLQGHTALVDRCAVYRQGTRMISASWDKTSKIWDLESGAVLMTLEDDNKVRGVVVYADETRAVTAGSGERLRIWDLETGELVDEVFHHHTSTVWGLRMLNEKQRLNHNGVWQEVPVVVTYSNDATIKAWNLSEHATSEIVHARRAANGPMCVAVLPSSYRLGKLSILVGTFASIALTDMSHLGTGPSAGAIWAGKSCMQLNRWIDWILDVIEESSAHFLYAPERGADLPTIIHKLAADADGHTVLEKIIKHFEKHRATILGGEVYVEKIHAKALSTIGIICRAGRSTKRSTALAVATEESQEDIAQLLLDDYRDHVKMLSRDNAPATEVVELTEGDMLLLFQKFPSLAADFLADLPLLRTKLVRPQSKCNFSDMKNGLFVRASTESNPHVGQFDDASFTLWWEQIIDRVWEKHKKRRDTKKKWRNLPVIKICFGEEIIARAKNLIEDELHIDIDGDGAVGDHDNNPTPHRQKRHADRMKDSAWGVKVTSKRVPIKGGTTNLDDTRLDLSYEMRDREQKRETLEAWARDDDDQASSERLFSNVARNIQRDQQQREQKQQQHNADWEEDILEPQEHSHKHLPFSQLLQACCDHAESEGPAVFESASLQAIIQYKWRLVSPIYFALCIHYMVFVVLFTSTTMFFHDLTCGTQSECLDATRVGSIGRWYPWSNSGLGDDYDAYSWYSVCGGWLLLFSTAAMWIMLIKHEIDQLRFHGVKYFWNGMNWWDLMSLVFSFGSLVWVCLDPQAATPAGRWKADPMDPSGARPLFFYHPLRTLRAVALFTTWINTSQWCQGTETYSFVVTVLVENIKSLWDVGVIFMLLMASFSLAFNELLGVDVKRVITQHGFTGPYDEVSVSFRTALGMALGDFDSDVYLDTNGAAPSLSFMLFVLYMFIVTIIMMNLLIAGMEQSYERVMEKRHLFMLQQRAEKLLEVEEILLTYKEKKDTSPCRGGGDSGNTNLDGSPAAPEIEQTEPDEKLGLPRGLERTLRAILRIPMQYSEYPVHMHTLEEVKLDLTSGGSEGSSPAQWRGRMTEVGSNAASQVESGPVGQAMRRLEQRTATIEDTMNKMKEDAGRTDQKLTQMMAALADIKGIIQPQQPQSV
jgi:WD40 repeat protein